MMMMMLLLWSSCLVGQLVSLPPYLWITLVRLHLCLWIRILIIIVIIVYELSCSSAVIAKIWLPNHPFSDFFYFFLSVETSFPRILQRLASASKLPEEISKYHPNVKRWNFISCILCFWEYCIWQVQVHCQRKGVGYTTSLHFPRFKDFQYIPYMHVENAN